jgi:hypothetical protein
MEQRSRKKVMGTLRKRSGGQSVSSVEAGAASGQLFWDWRMSLKLSGTLACFRAAARNGEACDESTGMQWNSMRPYAAPV